MGTIICTYVFNWGHVIAAMYTFIGNKGIWGNNLHFVQVQDDPSTVLGSFFSCIVKYDLIETPKGYTFGPLINIPVCMYLCL